MNFVKTTKAEIDSLESDIEDIRRDVFSGFLDFRLCYGQEIQDIAFVKKHFENLE